VVLWLPPTVEQFVHTPGNYRIIVDYFGNPPEAPIGVVAGVKNLLAHLDPGYLAGRVVDPGGLASSLDTGRALAGAALVVVWAASAVVAAFGLRHTSLTRLNLVLAAATVLGAVSLARVFGVVWYYLMLWVWGIAGLMVLAVVWTAVELVGRRRAGGWSPRAARIGVGVLAAVIAVAVVRFTIEAPGTEQSDLALSLVLADVVPPTAEALDDGVGAADGPDGRYLVRWSDTVAIGSQGYGMLNELERRGFDVGVPAPFGVIATRHRVLETDDATAQVVLATGTFVERWRDVPGVEEVATVDPRSAAERREFERLRAEVIDDLRASGLDDLVAAVDENLFAVGTDSRVAPLTRLDVNDMFDLGVPTSVFIAPPDASL
jgi:hypothetical protein